MADTPGALERVGADLVRMGGRIELRVPQDREGQFSTELFDRYQRSEKVLVAR